MTQFFGTAMQLFIHVGNIDLNLNEQNSLVLHLDSPSAQTLLRWIPVLDHVYRWGCLREKNYALVDFSSLPTCSRIQTAVQSLFWSNYWRVLRSPHIPQPARSCVKLLDFELLKSFFWLKRNQKFWLNGPQSSNLIVTAAITLLIKT